MTMNGRVVLIAFTALSVVFLSACERSSESTEADSAIEASLENANQDQRAGVSRLNGPPGMGDTSRAGDPPPEGPVSDSVPDQISTYKSIDGIDLKAHIFNAKGPNASEKSAALVFMHGGGLRHGSPTQGYDLADRFTPEGVAVVAVQYRLLGDNAETLDQVVADSKSAVRWLRENSDGVGIDPDRIAMAGHSAGSFLALATGVIPAFDEASENGEISSIPNALIPWASYIIQRDDPENSMLPEGMLFEDFSLDSHIRAGLPPALFIHGDSDPVAPYKVAMDFEERYRAAGNASSFHLIEGADHFFRPTEHREQVMAFIGGFLEDLGYSNVHGR